MPRTGWTPSLVPYGADQTVYLVVDRFAGLGTVYRETEVEQTDLETIITDLMSGQFNDPLRVVAFNTLEHWSEEQNGDSRSLPKVSVKLIVPKKNNRLAPLATCTNSRGGMDIIMCSSAPGPTVAGGHVSQATLQA
jgi:hypothetical protein